MSSKNFLDKAGVKILWRELSLQDYPKNETLMAVIEAIDETKADKSDIVQSDWNQNDASAKDYIKNRPFYSELVDGINYTWDGIVGDTPVYNINYQDREYSLIKVSDFTLMENDARVISGVMATNNSLSKEFEVPFSSFEQKNGYLYYRETFPSGGSVVVSVIFIVTTQDGASFLELPSTGVYVNYVKYNNDDASANYYFEQIDVPSGEHLVKIDTKYLPKLEDEMLSQDLMNITTIPSEKYPLNSLKEFVNLPTGYYNLTSPINIQACVGEDENYNPIYRPFLIDRLIYKNDISIISYGCGSSFDIVEVIDGELYSGWVVTLDGFGYPEASRILGLEEEEWLNTEAQTVIGAINELNANKADAFYVDSELSDTSENPVQNKVINAAISNLNTLVGDTAVSTQISEAIDGLVSYSTVQELTDEERAQARKNIDKYSINWVELSNPPIAIADYSAATGGASSFDMEAALNQASVVYSSWSSIGAIAFYGQTAIDGGKEKNIIKMIKNVVLDYDSLLTQGIISGSILNVCIRDEESFPIDIGCCISIDESNGTVGGISYTHIVSYNFSERIGMVFYNINTEEYYIDLSVANKADRTLSKESWAADAKAVGDALALKADQTALDAVSTLVGDTSVSMQISDAIDAIPQSDWNQNDETTKDYIKNRPFYGNLTITEILDVLKYDGEWIEEYGEVGWSPTNPDNMPIIDPVFIVGETYTLIVNGIEYECVVQGEDGVIALCDDASMTNYNVAAMFLPAEMAGLDAYAGKLIAYAVIAKSNLAPITEFRIVGMTGEIVKIDEKYLPNSVISGITTAQSTADNALNKANAAQATADEKMNATNPVGTGSFSMNRKSGTEIGECSHAEGQNTTASGDYSHAEGELTNADEDFSHAEGQSTTAYGKGSHAEGLGSKAGGYASHAEGNSTMATGSISHAEGDITKASGDYSHAEGGNTIASGDYSHAEGGNTIASGDYSHAEGSGTCIAYTLTGDANSTIYTIKGKVDFIKEGMILMYNDIYANIISWDETTLTITTDKTLSSTALNKQRVHLISNLASGQSSHTEGAGTKASGQSSHAEGYNTTASGEYSHASGYGTIASGNYSHTQGHNTIANHGHMTALGRYNLCDDTEYVLKKIKESENISLFDVHYYADDYTVDENLDFRLVNPTKGYTTLESVAYKYTVGSTSPTMYLGILSRIVPSSTSSTGYMIEDYKMVPSTEWGGKYIVTAGNGDEFERSNAHTLDWDGNAWFAGDVYVGSTSGTNMDEGSKKLASEEYVDNAVANASGGSIFVVNITGDTANGYSADKTFAEMVEAYESGKEIVANILEEADGMTINSFMPSTCYIDSILFMFTLTARGMDTGSFSSTVMYIQADNSVMFEPKAINIGYTEALTTTSKYIVGAINELNAKHTEGTDALILLSPNGTRFNITVGDDGVLSATEITE